MFASCENVYKLLSSQVWSLLSPQTLHPLMYERKSKLFQALSPHGKGFPGDNLSFLNNVLGLRFHLSQASGERTVGGPLD